MNNVSNSRELCEAREGEIVRDGELSGVEHLTLEENINSGVGHLTLEENINVI